MKNKCNYNPSYKIQTDFYVIFTFFFDLDYLFFLMKITELKIAPLMRGKKF